METILIVMMLFLVWLDFDPQLPGKFVAAASGNPLGLVKYFGSAGVLLFTAKGFPSYLLFLYMRREGFYDYSILDGQHDSLRMVGASMFIGFAFVTAGLFCWLVVLKYKTDLFAKSAMSIVAAFLFAVFVMTASASGEYVMSIFATVICLVIALIASFMLGFAFDQKARFWWVPVAISFVMVTLPLYFIDGSSALVGHTLAIFKIGGIEVGSREPFDDPEAVERHYKLLLRGTDMVYLRDAKTGRNIILPVQAVRITYGFPMQR